MAAQEVERAVHQSDDLRFDPQLLQTACRNVLGQDAKNSPSFLASLLFLQVYPSFSLVCLDMKRTQNGLKIYASAQPDYNFFHLL